MRSLPVWILAGSLVLATACKSPQEAAEQERVSKVETGLSAGKAALEARDWALAVKHFKDASFATREAEPLLLLAQAHRAAGNRGAAVLALREAEQRARGAEPEIRRRLAELYLELDHRAEALTALESLRDARQLPDEDLLMLARLQGQSGDVDGAFTTLEPLLQARPDDPRAKTVEAEILLLRGEELLATKLLDRLLQENPTLAEARLVRARYFLNSGYPQYADADLALLPRAEAEQPSAVTLRARALNTLGRHGEAELLLKGLMEISGQTPELLSQLADTKLYLDRLDEAQALVDEALRLSPSDPRSQYMRGRILERQVQPQQARVAYERALESSPRFAPALSRLWVLQVEQGQNKEAMETLERIYFMGEATIEEKAALAGVYAELSMHVSRARMLIGEALRRDPENPRWQAIRAKVAKREVERSRGKGTVIIRGRSR